ncbi:MAG: mannonate dehydratase [Candidatus Acidiferrales bacterium]
MKIGLGLYRHMLTPEYFAFARQAGATHVVIHLTDYFNKGGSNPTNNQPTGEKSEAWGVAGDPEKIWTAEEMKKIRGEVEAADLKLYAIENIDPAFWHDVLLDGPKRAQQIENVKTILRHMGEAGIGVLGYNFSLAGVSGRVTGPWGRGGALTVAMDGVEETPIPNGMVWNMIYDENAPEGTLAPITHEELWRRLERFLADVLPTAERAGVRLAAHPDDPPVAMLRQQPRLVYEPQMYQRLIDANRSASNQLELCVGTVAEMARGDVYEAVENYSRQGKIAYIHLRNVVGKAPKYRETFIDNGQVDMIRILAILHKNNFDGVVIPDHTPQMSCAAPWHAGMAHTIGFMLAALATVEKAGNPPEGAAAPLAR